MPAQVIFAYANDNDKSLEFLKDEMDAVYESINRINIMQPGLVNPIRLPDVNKDKLFKEFEARKNELTIFHFSGHSGLFDLLFDNEELIDGRGIARLLEFAPNIELVFLNGCANKNLIDWFHEAGIKRVIATKQKVFDKMAGEFSKYFYELLSNDNVGDAFNKAKARMMAAKVEDVGQKYRHISTDVLSEEGDEFPYSIFYKPIYKKTGALNDNINDYNNWDKWRFSDYTFTPTVYKPCLNLLNTIGATGFEMVKYLQKSKSPDKAEITGFRQLHELYRKFKGVQDINFSGLLTGIITQLLPRPLGIIMRQLVSTAIEITQGKINKYDELLNYQFRFYDVLLKISCYTMVSDLYEVILKRRKNNKVIFFDNETQDDIIRMFSLKESDLVNFNYRELIQRIRLKIIQNEETPFISEHASIANAASAENLERAYQNIIRMKAQYRPNNMKAIVMLQAESMEAELCNVFREVYFILRYNLLVIRNIEAIKTRFNAERRFLHKYIVLRGNRGASDLDDQAGADYTDSYSVILVKGLHSIIDYLSLCPFVFDKNNFDEDKVSELFYFSHCSGDALVYEDVQEESRKIEIKLDEEDLEEFDDDNMPVITKVVSIPYVNEAVKKDGNLNKAKMTAQLQLIHYQFHFLKSEFENLSFVNKE